MQDKAGAKYGIGLQAGGTGSWQSIMPFAWSNGADLTKDGGKAYNFDSPEVLEAAKYYQSYFTDGISDKAAPATPTTEPDFVSGKVPMFISGPWMMSAVEKVGGAGFKDKYERHADPGQEEVVARSSAARTSSSSRTARTATPPGSSSSGSPTPRPRSSGTSSRPTCRRVGAPGRTRRFSSDKKLAVFGKQLETAQAPPSFPTWEQVVDRVRHRDGEGHQAGRRPGCRAEDRAAAGRVHRDRPVSHGHHHRGASGSGEPRPPRAGQPSRPGRSCGRAGRRGSWPCRSACSSSSSPCGRCSSRSS